MALTEREAEQIERANGSGRTPVVFIHGLWLLPSSWDRWAQAFDQAGCTSLTPSWPDDPETVDQARANPEVFANKTIGQVADHTAEVIGTLTRKPAVVGHSFGGLLAQIIAGRGLSAASVAIDSAPFRGVLPLPISSLRSSFPVLSNPANRRRAIALTYDQFRYGWANALDEEEAKQLHETFHVAAPGAPLFQAATANLNPRTEARVDTRNPERGPLLMGKGPHRPLGDRQRLLQEAAAKRGRVTEIEEIPDRGHALTIDSGWKEVADTALAFVRRFVQ
jgi:non-heme chloroperoxidase